MTGSTKLKPMNSEPHDSVPGLAPDRASSAVEVLDGRLVALLDMQLTLKHVHWNMVGPGFISVHEMLDDQVGPVRDMVDALAERIRTLGGTPVGTPASIVERRSWDDYDLLRESVYVHLKKLDEVYDGIIADHRAAISELSELDPVSEDLLIAQTGTLEMFQWFVRSFFERSETTEEHHRTKASNGADSR